MNKTIPDFIIELVENGVSVSLTKEGYWIEGFYKSGNVEIKHNIGNGWEAFARYNEVTQIRDTVDIVSLNYIWWQRGKERYEGWSQPDGAWIPLLEKYGYITKKTIPEQVIYE